MIMRARRHSRKKQYNLEKLGGFLFTTLEKKKIYIDSADPGIVESWKQAVGPQITAQTDPYKFKNGMLFVKVSTSAWMQQLQFMKQEILDKVNATLPDKKIKNIRFSIGHQPSIVPTASPVEKNHFDIGMLRKRDKKLIEKNLTPITDDELREIVKRVMIKEIITRKDRP